MRMFKIILIIRKDDKIEAEISMVIAPEAGLAKVYGTDMGNQITATAPAQILPLESYFNELTDYSKPTRSAENQFAYL